MNEQEIMIQKKIEKREKTDTVIAYLLIIILLACALVVSYIYFFKEKKEDKPEEIKPNYITTSEITDLLNNSKLANTYKTDNAVFTATNTINGIDINYKKEDKEIKFSIPLVNNELEINITEDNKIISEDIYKEIEVELCKYYDNTESSCRQAVNKLTPDTPIDGIRYSKTDNNITVYIDITKKIAVENIVEYTEVTPVELEKTDYELSLNNTKINSIKVSTSTESITISGSIKDIDVNSSEISVITKLYNDNNEVLKEEKQIFEKDTLTTEKNFEITINLDENTKLEDVKKYSIEVNR